MNKGQAKKAQDDLDAATRDLRRLMDYAGDSADQLCEAGDNENSARFRKVQGLLTLAYAEGRTICMADDAGDLIQPLSGRK